MKWKELNKDGSDIDDLENEVLATNAEGDEYLYGYVTFGGSGWKCETEFCIMYDITHYLVIYKPE